MSYGKWRWTLNLRQKLYPEPHKHKPRAIGRSIAVVSCANWQHGFFNVYDYIARKSHFDALLHLGDYIYEYGAENALDHPAGRQGRLHEPRHEIITLDDYRTRHAQYRTDIALQSVTAKMPLISIWDDHETRIFSEAMITETF